jgi:chemotaxis protein MotB
MRQRRGRGLEEGSLSHERWLISYADFITLLFAFFVVLFASAYRDSMQVKRVSKAIHRGFREMGSSLPLPSNIFLPLDFATSPPAQKNLDSRGKSNKVSTASAVDIAKLRRELEAAIGSELKSGEVDLRVTPEGFVISLKDLGFFNSGQAVLQPGAAAKIERIAKVLVQQGLEIRVEGHSDDQPIHTAQFRSNWELSTARAMTVLLLLVNQAGLNPSSVSVAGYGQYRPIADNSTPAGRQMNRRVDLVVVAGALPGQHASASTAGSR